MTKSEINVILQEINFQLQHISQNKLATKLGVSTATLSQMVNHNHDLIKADMWRKVKVKLKLDLEWQVAPTTNFYTFCKMLYDVQQNHFSIGISEKAGMGKSEAYKHYARKYKNVIHIECKNYWSKKSYIKNLLKSSGLDDHGTTEELIEKLLDYLMSIESPLMIIDQADKLKDSQLDLFMDFYNDLFGHCAFVISGVKALEKRIKRGIQRDKMGYRELWSRIGSKFYDKLVPTSLRDVELVCQANGIDDHQAINEIFNISGGDLRVVRRKVKAQKLMKTKKTA